MLVSSVAVFGLASFALDAAYFSTIEYTANVLGAALHGKPMSEASVADIQAAAQWAANNADNLYLAKLALVQAAAATLKYFIPAILAALGVWSLEKCMDRDLSIV